jgi:hypothetical protein
VGKLFCRCIKDRVEMAVGLHEGQAGFRHERSTTDNLFVLSELIRQRAAALKRHTYVFYLDVRKAFDSVWHDGLWCKLWDKGVRGKLWRTIRNMYSKMRSRVRVNGHTSNDFPVERGTAQGCTLSPLLFNIFIDGLLEAVEAAGLGVPVGDGGSRIGGLMFADDFAGMEATAEDLQRLIDVAADYLRQWGMSANVSKSAVVVYGPARGRGSAQGQPYTWRWGSETGAPIPQQDDYKYLGVRLHSNTSWASHIDALISRGKAALSQYGRFLKARTLDRAVRLLIYKQYVRPLLDYGAEVWRPTSSQGAELERLQLSAARAILGCHTNTASEAVRAELGLETLEARRMLARLRWYAAVRGMPLHRYPARVFSQFPPSSNPGSAQRSSAPWRAHTQLAWGSYIANPNPNPDPNPDPNTNPDPYAHPEINPVLDDFYSAHPGPHFLSLARSALRQAQQQQLQTAMAIKGEGVPSHLRKCFFLFFTGVLCRFGNLSVPG